MAVCVMYCVGVSDCLLLFRVRVCLHQIMCVCVCFFFFFFCVCVREIMCVFLCACVRLCVCEIMYLCVFIYMCVCISCVCMRFATFFLYVGTQSRYTQHIVSANNT